ncbi:hypothetical protein [Pontibacter rugosus]|uniref:Cardiolipin synthase N-terminal domain-containing protein n=1 Tax=Pontibacter rugosus TaxID=1745966 RepID=A0ABW3SMI0_9BACT
MGEAILGLGILGLVLGLVGLIIYVWSIIWAYKDAERRGKPGWLVAIVVAFLAWPVGLILWLIIRPKNNSYSHHH